MCSFHDSHLCEGVRIIPVLLGVLALVGCCGRFEGGWPILVRVNSFRNTLHPTCESLRLRERNWHLFFFQEDISGMQILFLLCKQVAEDWPNCFVPSNNLLDKDIPTKEVCQKPLSCSLLTSTLDGKDLRFVKRVLQGDLGWWCYHFTIIGWFLCFFVLIPERLESIQFGPDNNLCILRLVKFCRYVPAENLFCLLRKVFHVRFCWNFWNFFNPSVCHLYWVQGKTFKSQSCYLVPRQEKRCQWWYIGMQWDNVLSCRKLLDPVMIQGHRQRLTKWLRISLKRKGLGTCRNYLFRMEGFMKMVGC